MDLETRYEKDQTTLSDLSSYYANVTTSHRFSYECGRTYFLTYYDNFGLFKS